MEIKNIRIAFMGTPDFATTILEGLINHGYNVVAVISQPDKEVGRKKIIEPTPVKKVALKYGINVYQPIKIRKDFSFFEEIKPDLIITCAYGQIVPQEVLDFPPYGCINVHGSLLPSYRGGAPIQRAIMNGDKKTGITIMEMIAEMDAGKMYSKAEVNIDINDTYDDLSQKLQIKGRDLLLETLPSYLDFSLKGEEQNKEKVTYAFNIKREEEKIDWYRSSLDIHNHIRGLSSNPATYTMLEDKELKVFKSKLLDIKVDGMFEPGTIAKCDKNGFIVKTLDGFIHLEEIQLQGKKRMFYKDFVNGLKENIVGKKFN
ncbi:MAG: methionyl-tRNA formyltransferase [Erysipelotrichaceae bacterium]|nr:methionyl-tRNA formyltransferase [Erysipelotrichaceae bacterium]